MRNTLVIRKMIDYYKDKYSSNKDKDMLIYIAILKGAYLASGGKKGIPLSNSIDFKVKHSKILFSYEKRLNTHKDKLKAHIWLEEELRKNGKYIGCIEERTNNIPTNNIIAQYLAELINTEYKEDLFINSNKIYSITIEIVSNLNTINK